MKGYDFKAGDVVIADGHLHHWYPMRGCDEVRVHFPDRQDLVELIRDCEQGNGIELNETALNILETDDEIAVVQLDGHPGAYVSSKGTYDNYISVVEIRCGIAINPGDILRLLETAV